MNAGPDVERRISEWLADEVTTRAPDRILPTTFERTRRTHQRRFGAAWRTITMNRTWQLATTAVAGVLVVGLGALWLARPGGAGVQPPSPSPSPSPTLPPAGTPSPYPTAGIAAPGTYVLAYPNTPSITFAVPSGWGFGGGGGPVKNDGTTRSIGLSTWLVGNVYANPCQWGNGFVQPLVGPFVDDLANALARQPLRNGTTPTAVTMDGYSGKYLELTTPSDLDPSTCSKVPAAGPGSPGFFVTWMDTEGGYMGFAGPGSRDRVWILNVEGVRFVLAATEFRDATAQDRAELQAIIDSIRIVPVPGTPTQPPTSSRI